MTAPLTLATAQMGVAAPTNCLDPVPTLRQVFEGITATSCPSTYNFHMHTCCSDGQLQPEALIQQAIALGLRGLAITDHHTVGGFLRAQRWLRDHGDPQGQPWLWTGIEVTVGLLDTEVHVLGYDFDPDHDSLIPYLQEGTPQGEAHQAGAAVRAIQAAGGLAVLAHPARYRRSPEDLVPAAVDLGIDGVETYYAYGQAIPWVPSPKQTRLMEKLGKRHRLLQTCGTDTHGLNLLQRI